MSKAFASTGDLGPKQISFGEIGRAATRSPPRAIRIRA